MTVQTYPNGMGGTLGDSLDLAKPLMTTGNVWYVSSVTGTDASGTAGQNREKPLATLAQAVTNSSSGDFIVFLQGHTQTLASVQTIAKSLVLIGEGTTSGKPGASFNQGVAGGILFDLTARVELRNIYFPAAAVTTTGSKVRISAADCRVRGCYFEQGATDNSMGVSIENAGDRFRFDNNTVISTATSTAVQPSTGLRLNGSGINALEISNSTFSAGAVGFSNYAAIDLSLSAIGSLRVQGLSLLLGADMSINASTGGYVNISTSTGGSRVSWS